MELRAFRLRSYVPSERSYVLRTTNVFERQMYRLNSFNFSNFSNFSRSTLVACLSKNFPHFPPMKWRKN